MKIKIETTPEVRQLNSALENFDRVTLGKYDENPNLPELANIAEAEGMPLTAEIMREHAGK